MVRAVLQKMRVCGKSEKFLRKLKKAKTREKVFEPFENFCHVLSNFFLFLKLFEGRKVVFELNSQFNLILRLCLKELMSK